MGTRTAQGALYGMGVGSVPAMFEGLIEGLTKAAKADDELKAMYAENVLGYKRDEQNT